MHAIGIVLAVIVYGYVMWRYVITNIIEAFRK